METIQKPYTVILLRPLDLANSPNDTFMAHVTAASPRDAADAAQEQAAASDDAADLDLSPWDYEILFIFDGHLTSY